MRRGATFVDVRIREGIQGAPHSGRAARSLRRKEPEGHRVRCGGGRASPASTARPHEAGELRCNGAECWKSYKASKVALARGFTTMYWFRGGLPEWLARGLPNDQGA